MSRATRRVVVSTALTVVVGFGCVLYGFSVYATDQAAGAEFSTSWLSLAFAGAVITSGLSAIPVGRIMDVRGVRGVIPIGGALTGSGLWLFSVTSDPWLVLVAWWLLIGPGTAAVYYEPAFLAINQWVAEVDRPKALGWLTVIGGLAGAIFIPLIERLTTWLGWRGAVQVAAAMVVGTSLLASLIWLPRGRGPHAAQRSIAGPLTSLRDDPVFLWFTLAMMLAFAAMQGVIVHRLDLFAEAGFSLALVAAWAGAASLISLPGRYAGPVVGDRTSLVVTMVGVIGLLSVSTVLAATATTVFAMTSHFVVFGLVFGAVTPLRALMMNKWYAGDRFGAVMGVQKTATLLASSLGPLFVGVGRDLAGSYTTPMVAITALGAVAAGAVAMAGSAHRRHQTV